MITFQCECGKVHRAADEHAGKRGKCSACGSTMSIPSSLPAASRTTPTATKKPAAPVTQPSAKAKSSSGIDGPAPSSLYDLDDEAPSRPAPRGRPCPNCAKPLPTLDATFCVECGYNLKTGKKTTLEVTKPKKPKKRKSSGVGTAIGRRLTSGKFLGGLGSLAGGSIWLLVGLMAGRIFFYPIFLVIAGIFGVISGLIGGDD